MVTDTVRTNEAPLCIKAGSNAVHTYVDVVAHLQDTPLGKRLLAGAKAA
jgi:hypothetical protein